jgi:predicted nucleic acid-binding protein
MNVLVDTPVWSLALRRHAGNLSQSEEKLARSLADLIREGRAEVLGSIRQEVLSGIREETQFNKIRKYLCPFQDPYLDVEDYEEAAHMSNLCRRRGVSGSAIDFLICAVAHRRSWAVFSTDGDFRHFAAVLPLHLFTPV